MGNQGVGAGGYGLCPDMPDTWPGWEDSSIPPDKVGDYLRALRDLFHKYSYEAALYGHFGQGCIHCRIDFDLVTARASKPIRGSPKKPPGW